MTIPAPDSVVLEESLRHAAMFGNAETVERLLLSGVNIDAADNRGWTALLRATQRRHFAISRLLIERGANVNLADKRQRSSLLWVAQYGNVETARLLLEKDAERNSPDVNGKTPLKQAVIHGRIDILEILLQGIEWHRSTKNYYQSEALALAIDAGNTQAVKVILDSGIDLSANSPHYGSTRLMRAAENQNVDIARLLLDYGASPTEKTYTRQSALTVCLSRPLPENVIDSVKNLLLQRGATIGLEEAVVVEDAIYARGILERGGADVEMPDANGRTLLMWAVQHGNHETVRVLTEYGADVNRADRYHKISLMKASARGDLETIKYLISRGANPRFIIRHSGWVAFDFAAAHGHLDTAAWLLENFRFGFGAYRGGGTLAAAAEKGHLSTVQFLLDNGVNPNTATNLFYGRTALMWAGCRR